MPQIRRAVRILLAEDSPADALLFQEALRRGGLEVEIDHCQDGDQFVRRMGDFAPGKSPDLCVIDLSLPKVNGLDLLKAVRTNPALHQIPMIVLTSSRSAKDRYECLDWGANAFITKPAGFDDFVNVVGAAIRSALVGEDAVRRLASIIESCQDAIISQSIEGIVQSWNSGAERIYGYRAEEMIGRPITMLLPQNRAAEEAEKEAEILARLQHGEPVRHFETVRIRKQGQPVYVSLSLSPLSNRDGEMVGVSHVARDITLKREHERNSARLAAIVESSTDAIVGKNLDGIIETWNNGAERIFGYTFEEALGRPMNILLPKDRQDEETEILASINAGRSIENFETVRVRKDGVPIQVSLTISPIRDRDRKVVGVSHIARDITAVKLTEEHLHQRQKLESLGVLAGGVAHDFNNLLTGILGNASMVLETGAPAAEDRPYLEAIVKTAERAAALTRQLLAYAGKGRSATTSVNLSEVTREISGLIDKLIPRNVGLRLNLDPDIPSICGDPGQLEQVIMNLIINAAEAIGGDQAGEVTVTTGVQCVDGDFAYAGWTRPDLPSGCYARLEVADTGCGMDDAVVSRIFDPFFTTKFTGRGLGLAAVSGIVQSHQGALRVRSSPGSGSTFELLFPATGAPAEVPQRPQRDSKEKASGTILVVDDEEVIRDLARRALERLGYRVVLACDGKEAVAQFREAPDDFSLVLLDLTMPVMGGAEALQELRAIRPQLPVLLSSGFDETTAAATFAGDRSVGFIQKPYSAGLLADRVKELESLILT